MSDNNKQENKTEELLEKQEAHKLTEEDLEQVTGGCAPSTATGVVPPDIGIEGLQCLSERPA